MDTANLAALISVVSGVAILSAYLTGERLKVSSLVKEVNILKRWSHQEQIKSAVAADRMRRNSMPQFNPAFLEKHRLEIDREIQSRWHEIEVKKWEEFPPDEQIWSKLVKFMGYAEIERRATDLDWTPFEYISMAIELTKVEWIEIHGPEGMGT